MTYLTELRRESKVKIVNNFNGLGSVNMREYIRHPSDIPIEFSLDNTLKKNKELLNNVSEGGLSFQSNLFIEPSSIINVSVPFFKYKMNIKSIVVWCKKNSDYYDIGVEFIDLENEFRARMVEQICYIEHFKKEVYINEGRKLTGEEAAIEWIKKFAKNFPYYS